MKNFIRIISVITLIFILTASLVSCKDEKYEAYDRTGQPYDYYLPDYVEVCDYIGIEIPDVVYAPTEDDIHNKKMQLAGYYCDSFMDPDRPCKEYDYVDIITTCKFTDTGEKYSLFTFDLRDTGCGQTFLLGSNYFGFPALDDAIVGMSKGETKTVTLNLPDPFYKDYMNSGREVEMEIYVNYIEEVDYSPISDGFYYQYYGHYGEGLDAYVVEELSKEKNEWIDGYEIALTWNYVFENSELKKLPEKEYQDIYDSMLNNVRNAAQKKNMTLAEYVEEIYGYKTLEEYYDYLEMQAENVCFEEMILYYIIRYENLSYTDEFYQKAVLSMAEEFSLTDFAQAEDFLVYYMGEDGLQEDILMQYTQNWISEKAVVREDVHQFFSEELNKDR